MKKILIFLLAALLLGGCGAGTEAAAETTVPATTQASGTEIPEAADTTAPEAVGFAVTFRGVEIALGTPMEPVLAALGEPMSYTEQTSCAFEGLDKTYYYGSLYIQTNPAPEGDRIAAVWFADDSVATAEGVHIGADRAAVERAYGEFSGDACTLDKDGQRLMILLENGAVSSIQYTLAQE